MKIFLSLTPFSGENKVSTVSHGLVNFVFISSKSVYRYDFVIFEREVPSWATDSDKDAFDKEIIVSACKQFALNKPKNHNSRFYRFYRIISN